MSYSCKILLDSISETSKRITTFEITFPRIVLAEFNTHRMFSRNSASSRAIPFNKMLDKVRDHPFIPEKFPINCTGMQPQEYISREDTELGEISQYSQCEAAWLDARNRSIEVAKYLYEANDVHKQIVNRLLEPFQWHTVIVTATEFDNFFKLRCDENAQYEIRRIADLMYEAYHAFDNYDEKIHGPLISRADVDDKTFEQRWIVAKPQKLKVGEWHCPLISEEDRELCEKYIKEKGMLIQAYVGALDNIILGMLKKISVARCARVSYLTHDGKRDIEADLNLYERLLTSGHMSPFEHVATPFFIDKNTHLTKELTLDTSANKCDGWQRASSEEYAIDLFSGNFIGWQQLRKTIQGENCDYFRK